ncbi:hypothetical protein J6C36_05125 [Methanocorpusculaceae archaeon]|nr:hypothetical protein [Methanocorpusculaceae archaeon]MBO5119758.1 hypothetical protein [Methanocorpusculum sp.]MBO5368442.1 hypothetical protein [Methanocorpusculum sp.]MBO5430688.1 hypothetical protein [Methanocorpusculum sp.]MBP3443091.1 hypothetical protein [Methanocorpusculaceae archaeon]
MAVTAIGKRYARRVEDGTITVIEIPTKRLQDVRDSYLELFGVPMPEA